jgi:hypothetical protein
MKEFPSIESLRHLVKEVRTACDYKSKPYPTIDFLGTVKLHGTNAGVRVTETKVQAQGRTRILDIQGDNFGFAFYVSTRNDIFRNLKDTILPYSTDVTFFGEWIGPGIQKAVAVSELPSKQFVIFSVYDADEDTIYPISDIPNLQDAEALMLPLLNEQSIYFISQVDNYLVSVDFKNPEAAALEIERMTLLVEQECPWGKKFGIIGTGEGIVWTAVNLDYRLWFKSKGLKHKKVPKDKPKVEVDPVRVEGINKLVEAILPEWRLEQGFSFLRENGHDLSVHSTGKYLKWICQDIIKEETDVIAANGFEWRDVVGHVNAKARTYFLESLDKMLGIK